MRARVPLALGVAFLVACGSSDDGSAGDQDSSTDDTLAFDGEGDTSPVDSGGGDATSDTRSSDTGSAGDTRTDVGTDGGADTGVDAGPCGGLVCGIGQICKRQYTTGAYAYSCIDMPTSCPGSATCAGKCGTDLCGACACESAAATTVTCHCSGP